MTEANCISLRSLLSTIPTFKGLLEMFVILTKLFCDCIVRITFQNCRDLYYRYICWYYCTCTFVHLAMMPSSINQMKLMIYNTIELITLNLKDITSKYGPNETHNDTNIQSCDSTNCASINYILMLILEELYIIYLVYTQNAFSIAIIFDIMFGINLLVDLMYFVFGVVCPTIYEACLIRSSMSNATIHSGMFDYVFAMICSGNSHIYYFMDIFCTFYIHDTIVKTIYSHFESIFQSIIRLFIQQLYIFINWIVYVINIGFKTGNHKSYCKFIYCYCLSFVYSIMIYLLPQASKSNIYVILEWIKPHFNHLSDKVNRYKLQNGNMIV